jgi:hypothetical protein
MKDEAKNQLRRILGDYDEKLAETERADAASRAAHAAFPERFATLRADTIRPALEEIVELLNKRGHDASVREQEESSSAEGGVKSAAVSLRVVPKPFAHKSTEPSPIAIEVAFSANRREQKVAVSSTNTMVNQGGTVGKRAEYEIDGVTADVVASHAIQTLTEALAGTR